MEFLMSLGFMLAEESSMAHHFTITAMWSAMGFVGKLTIVVLMIMSMMSVYVMIDRSIAFTIKGS